MADESENNNVQIGVPYGVLQEVYEAVDIALGYLPMVETTVPRFRSIHNDDQYAIEAARSKLGRILSDAYAAMEED